MTVPYNKPALFLPRQISRRWLCGDLEELMDFRVDAKGKYYTTRVSKQSVAVVARVQDSIVQGTVHLAPDNRLKDELNGDETFLAVTQAEVWEIDGEHPLYTTEVLIVNKSQIIWIFPREPVQPESGTDA
jgi:hypothetical protein